MSRGPGRIERAIESIFRTEPGDAFTTEDLIDRIYPAVDTAQKKHRVVTMRAAKNVCERIDGWVWWQSESRGGTLVFWNRCDVMSYATARLKTDEINYYRHKDTRIPAHWRGSPESIRAKLSPGGDHYEFVAQGGAWWRHVQLNIAERDGDTSERVSALRAEQDAANKRADYAMSQLGLLLSR